MALSLRQFIVCATVAAVFGSLGTPARAAIVTSLNPASDAFVSAANSTNNYGGAGSMSIAAAALANGQFQSLLTFNAAAVKTASDSAFGTGNWAVQSVTITLSANAPTNAIFNTSAAGNFSLDFLANDSWTEGTGTPNIPQTTGITFATLPSFEGAGDQLLGTFAYGGATTGNSTYTLGLSSNLVADLLAGNAVSFRGYAADANVSYLYNSRSFGTVAERPVLAITTIAAPEPASLLALGVASLVLLRRNPRQA